MALLRRKDERIEVLRSIPLFADLSKRELGALAPHVTEIRISEGDLLAEQGSKGKQAMVILEGQAVVRRDGRKVAEVGKGDVVGELSLITDTPRTATVEAASDMVVLLMDSRDFSAVIDEHPQVAAKLLRTVAERLAQLQRGV